MHKCNWKSDFNFTHIHKYTCVCILISFGIFCSVHNLEKNVLNDFEKKSTLIIIRYVSWKMFLQKISTLEGFLIYHVTLKTGVMPTKINLCIMWIKYTFFSKISKIYSNCYFRVIIIIYHIITVFTVFFIK